MNIFDFFNTGVGNGRSTENMDNDKFHLDGMIDWDANDSSSADFSGDFAAANNNNNNNNNININQGENNIHNFYRDSGETKQKINSIPKSHNFLSHGDPNTSDTSFKEDQQQQQQQFLHYSTPQQYQQQRHQHEVPLPVSSQNDWGETNNNPIYSSTQQPQHLSQVQDPRHDRVPSQPQRLKSPMHPNKHYEKIRDEDHHSVSLLEQQHSVDRLLAKELNQLSFRERNEINEEIHGVSTLYTVDETPELICQSLEQLRFELNNHVPMHSKMAYERSQQIYKENLQIREPCSVSSLSGSISSLNKISIPKSYVNDPDFLLLFLRREKFDVRKTALRLVNFMELVYELWGEKALTEKTWQSQTHLDPFEREVLRTGTMQVLQGRDRAGRRILGNFADDNSKLTVENRLRLSLYCAMAVLDDVETQKKGAVGVTMWHNVSIDDFQGRGQCHKRLSNSTPIRLSAIHLCLPHDNTSATTDSNAKNLRRTANPKLLRLLKAMFVVSIGAEFRPHLRVHVGSTVECMYALQSFGILSEQIPINTTTGKIKTKQHLKWLESKLQKEEALKENKPFNKIGCPMMKDVLFGRGWPIMKHPGNVMLRNIIDSKLEEYQNEKSKRGKTLIAQAIVCMVKQKEIGGRFLKEDSDWWVEVSNDMARQKVSIAFRDARKLKMNNSRSNGKKTQLNSQDIDEIR